MKRQHLKEVQELHRCLSVAIILYTYSRVVPARGRDDNVVEALS